MNLYLEILIRSLVSVATLLVFCRLVGARQISQMTFYDYVSGITIGSIAGTLCVDPDIDAWSSVLAIAVFAVATIAIAWVTGKSIFLRRVLTGSAHILIDNGKIIEKALKFTRMDVNDVLRELRSQGYFSVGEIKYAVLETNGHVSVMPYSSARPATNGDLRLHAEESTLESNVVIDGKLMERNLEASGKTPEWLCAELKKQQTEMKDVLLATVDGDGALSVFEKGETCRHNTLFE